MTAIDYGIVLVVMTFLYGMITHFWPDFPLSAELFYSFVLYLIGKTGVVVIGKPVEKLVNLSSTKVKGLFKATRG